MAKKLTHWIIASLFAISLFFFPTLIKADVLIKKIKHTDKTIDMMGQPQPSKDEEGIVWMAKDKMRDDMGETSIIVRFDLKKIYIIDHSKKTYSETDLPIDLEKVIPPEAKQIMKMMQVTTNFSVTNETQKIKNWDCKKHLVEITVSMMGMKILIKMEIWASKDLGINLNAYHKSYSAILSTNPFTKGLSEEVKKMEGYPVVTIYSMTISGTETKYREEVVSVEKKGAPAGIYDLPQGYKKIPFNPLGQNNL